MQKSWFTYIYYKVNDKWLTTWNFTWRHIERFLRPAVPDMKVRRMLPTLLREVDPSIPTMEPLTIPATGAFTVLKSSLMFCLQKVLICCVKWVWLVKTVVKHKCPQ